ncbi:uncharacterized protein FOMMEDRAFT_169817 [Fomitiporia mediterranea MF3/22]|uniref:uncharacterized protein n=1 Tax=Fomitiporia mediterranea (strain MF3/22) TaxID=694068 RepID=UPI0004407F50|nr:uncharacterized protein FOMMEDRAFT_169817 [Fomitiporia mediterranea MF3/22]EJD00278.1 hypothetical protein FOMMEDRAFT_169817 [Fomitiporia mediterranea MF3/22]
MLSAQAPGDAGSGVSSPRYKTTVFGRPKRLLNRHLYEKRPPSFDEQHDAQRAREVSDQGASYDDFNHALAIAMLKGPGDAVGKPRHKFADERSGQFALILKPVLWPPEPRECVEGAAYKQERWNPSLLVAKLPVQDSSVRTETFPGRKDDLDLALMAATTRDFGDAVGKPRYRPADKSGQFAFTIKPVLWLSKPGKHISSVAFKRERRNSGLLFISNSGAHIRLYLAMPTVAQRQSADEHQQIVTSRGTGTQLNVRANHRQRRIRNAGQLSSVLTETFSGREDDLDSLLTAATTKIFGDAVGKPRHGLADEESGWFTLILKPVLWLSKEHIDGAAVKWKGRNSGLLFIWSLGARVRLNLSMVDALSRSIADAGSNAKSADEHQQTLTGRDTGTRLMLSAPTIGDAASWSSSINDRGEGRPLRCGQKTPVQTRWREEWPVCPRPQTRTLAFRIVGRKISGLTQVKMRILVSMSVPTIGDAESGSSSPREDDLDLGLMAAMANDFGDGVGKPRYGFVDEGSGQFVFVFKLAEFRSTLHLVLEPSHSTQSVYGGCTLSFDSRRWLDAKSADEHQRTVTSRGTDTRLMLFAPTSGDAKSKSSGPTQNRSLSSVRVQTFFWRDISRKASALSLPSRTASKTLERLESPYDICTTCSLAIQDAKLLGTVNHVNLLSLSTSPASSTSVERQLDPALRIATMRDPAEAAGKPRHRLAYEGSG